MVKKPPTSLVKITLIPNPVFVKEKFRKIFHVRNKKRTFLSRIWSSPFSLLLRKTRLWAEVVFLLWAKLLSSSPHLIFIETQQYAAHRKTGPQIERENLNLEKWNAINSLANSMRKIHINIFWGFMYSEHFRGWPGKGLWWINDLWCVTEAVLKEKLIKWKIRCWRKIKQMKKED